MDRPTPGTDDYDRYLVFIKELHDRYGASPELSRNLGIITSTSVSTARNDLATATHMQRKIPRVFEELGDELEPDLREAGIVLRDYRMVKSINGKN